MIKDFLKQEQLHNYKKLNFKKRSLPFILSIIYLTATVLTQFAGTGSSYKNFVGVYAAASAEEDWVTYSKPILSILEGRDEQDNYADYKRKLPKTNPLSTRVVYKVDGAKDIKLSHEKTSKSAVVINNTETVSFEITVNETGNYNMAFLYGVLEKDEKDIRCSLKINGKTPFLEAQRISFPQSWSDVLPLESDHRGNDIRPYVETVSWWREMQLSDDTGRFGPFEFYLEKGNHLVTLQSNADGLAIAELIILNANYTPTYAEYEKKFPGKTNIDYLYVLQAEEPFAKTSSSIQSGTDRSGPATQPSDPVALKLNMLFGNSWKIQGATAYWHMNIPQDGWYDINARFRQNYLPGLFTSRRLTVDGVAPFREAEYLSFNHDNNWKMQDLGRGKSFYLTKGVHVLGLEAVSGEMAGFLRSMEDTIYVLNHLYRKIIVISGNTPDPYRDYFLESEIPELLPVFDEVAGNLISMADRLEELTGKKGGNASILRETGKQLKDFVKDAQTIPKRIKSFQANISAISGLMLLIQEQPLDMDYIELKGNGTVSPPEKAKLTERMKFQIQAFLGSFFMDYSIIGSTSEGKDGKAPLKVWYGGSREQAEIVQRMIDDRFIRDYGIGVELELVQLPVAQAVFAKTAPDIVMNISRGQPVNLAARGALKDLSKMQGFNDLAPNFAKDAFLPYSYDGGVYGIPIQMDFHLLFIRDDIFEELNLQVPQTWDDFYKVLPVLQGNHMTVGLPYTPMSSQGSIDAGMGAKDLFPALLLQRHGKIYNDKLSGSALDSEITLDAFKMWTDIYSKYELPLVYDFYNRFRSGEIPMGIQGYQTYNLLEAAAPEIRGLWSMHLILGTKGEDGKVDHSAAASGSAAIMIDHGEDTREEEGWKFLQWWSSADAQVRYGQDIETLMGKASRYNPANIEAIKRLPWSEEHKEILLEQISWLTEIPEIPGGYYTSRSLDNAFRNVVFSKRNYRDALLEQHVIINSEIARKRKEFKLDGE